MNMWGECLVLKKGGTTEVVGLQFGGKILMMMMMMMIVHVCLKRVNWMVRPILERVFVCVCEGFMFFFARAFIIINLNNQAYMM